MLPRRTRSALVALGTALLVAAGGSRASDEGGLLWPTNAGRCVTSTFCEFRSGHFHSGIDISTNGRTGFECRAVADGDVVRVRVGCKGYGKAIYLRMRDGRTAVYAHLSKFAGAIEDSARAIGRRSGESYFDREFPPGTFAVRRGDVVAYTGETGVGVPHLHVEIRDERERPLDPLRAGLAVADSRAPRIRRITLTPLGAGSAVDGGAATVFVDAGSQGATVRLIPVEGSIGIAVDVDDATDGCPYDLAPSAIELLENGRTISSIQYDAFSFDETDRLDFQIDPRYSYASSARYQNLFRHVGYDLPFASGSGSGAIEGGASGEERRRLEIVARDAKGNESHAEIELSFGAPPEVTTLTAEEDGAAVAGVARAGGRDIARIELETSTDGGRTWRAAPPATPSGDGSFRTELLRDGVGDIVRAQAVDRLGVAGIPRSVGRGSAPGRPDSVAARVVTRGSFVELRIPEEAPFREIEIEGHVADPLAPGTRPLLRPWGKAARVDVPAQVASGNGAKRTIVLVDPWGGRVIVAAASAMTASPSGTARIPSPSGRAEIVFLPETVRQPTAVMVRETKAPKRVPGQLVPLGPLVSVDCGAVPLAADYEALLRPSASAKKSSGRVGVFVQSGDRFQYIGGRADEARGGWTARTRTPLPFGLFEDRGAPVIGTPRLELRSGRPCLVFRVTEAGSGFDCDGIEVLHEGAKVPNELDEERGDVCAYPELSAERGASGTFEIRATDRCGNASRRTETVRLP